MVGLAGGFPKAAKAAARSEVAAEIASWNAVNTALISVFVVAPSRADLRVAFAALVASTNFLNIAFLASLYSFSSVRYLAIAAEY